MKLFFSKKYVFSELYWDNEYESWELCSRKMENRNEFYYYSLKTMGYLRYITCWFDIHVQSKMITLKLINIFISSYSYHLCVLVRAPEIYSLTKFLVFTTALLTKTIMLCIRSINWLVLSNYDSILQPATPHFSHLPAPGNHHFTPCLYFTFLDSTYK